jgi:hypothetical protein
MMFSRFSSKILAPLFMVIMMAGIFLICQPWSMFLHRHGFIISLAGFIGFLVFSHFRPAED